MPILNEALFEFGDLTVSAPDKCRDFNFTVPSTTKRMRAIMAPTTYTVKANSLFNIQVTTTNAAWYYSGLSYNDDTIKLYARFQPYKSDTGVEGSVAMTNTKKAGQKSTMAGDVVPATTELSMMDNVPIHYYGHSLASKKPTDTSVPNTFLTKVIDEDAIEVECLSPFEYKITVKEDPALTSDQWFYLPESNAKGLSSTIWGKLGEESTLPDGACAGLIKVHAQSILSSGNGDYLVSGNELSAVKMADGYVIQHFTEVLGIAPPEVLEETPTGSRYDRINQFKGTTEPDWWANWQTTLEDLPVYQTLKTMIDENRQWYALGYKTGVCTVGTGLFVRNNNKPALLPYGNTATGIQYKRNFIQDKSNPKASATIGELLECEDFLERLAKIGLQADIAETGAVIPICAADIQYKDNTAGPTGWYHPPYDTVFRYAQKTFDNSLPLSTTPLYIPSDGGLHCYVPKLFVGAATRFCMIQHNALTEDVALTLGAEPQWLELYTTTVESTYNTSYNSYPSRVRPLSKTTDTNVPPHSITENPVIEYVAPSNPTNGLSRDQFGFAIEVNHASYDIRITRSYSVSNVYSGFQDVKASVKWASTSSDPVIGVDASSSQATLHSGISGMVMAFTGFLPAGTPKGEYLFKPIATAEQASGYISCDPSPTNIPTSIEAPIIADNMEAPYIGTNYVYAESPNVLWNYDQQTDSLGDYTFYRNMLDVKLDPTTVTPMQSEIIVALNPEHTPLVGYPVADRPTLIQLDDISGEYVGNTEDLMMTAPFYDEDVGDWVVIAASGTTGKFYRIIVEVDSTKKHIVEFKTVKDSANLFDTPYGQFTELLGICHTKDIHYLDSRAEEVKKALAADIVFLVDDSGSMTTDMAELKSNIGSLFTELYNTGIEDIRIGMACYDTKQQSVFYNDGSTNHLWAENQAQAQAMANQLAINFVQGSTSRSAHHWSAIKWALDNYEFRNVKSRYIILVSDTGHESDSSTEAEATAKLLSKTIRLDVVGNASAYFTNVVNATDGTFIGMTTDSGSRNWGPVMAQTFGPKIIDEIKALTSISVADDHLVIYGITEATESSAVKGSNLVVATCRKSMEWDVNKDTIVRIKVEDGTDTDYTINTDIVWPKGIAVMFPYIYALGYVYSTIPSKPVEYEGIATNSLEITGKGWQMCMWKIDITSGKVNDTILLKDAVAFRFNYGIPACDKDTKSVLNDEFSSIGKYPAKYTSNKWATSGSKITIPMAKSDNLPLKSETSKFPSVTGLCYVAGQLVAFSNYHESPVLINPLVGIIETTGLSIFPFTYPFNNNVAVSGETLATISRFGGHPYYTTHPFYQLCIGDGTSPNNYGMGIDVSDITTGEKLLRKCYIRNNSLRDKLTKVQLSVPNAVILPGSEMLYLSLTGNDADKAKSITFDTALHPCDKAVFYLHVEPTASFEDENLILYLNAKFSRVTEYFGYKL